LNSFIHRPNRVIHRKCVVMHRKRRSNAIQADWRTSMKRFSFFVCLLLVFWLTACQVATAVPTKTPALTATVSRTQEPTGIATVTEINTVAPTVMETATISPTSTPVITVTPLPTASKKVLFLYASIGDHSNFDLYRYSDFWPIMAIYTDGQIIMSGNPDREKMMSPKELDNFLAKLDKLGFYTIESNQKHDPSDSLYTMTDKDYERIYDATSYCLFVYAKKTRRLCYYTPFERFLVHQMQDLLQFVDEYDLPDMSPYSPERILISVNTGNMTDDPKLQAIPWRESSLSLAELTIKNYGVNFVGGNLAKKLYGQYGSKTHVFMENEQEYTVYILDVWPHEELISPTN
jgi:hypothetical protein